MTAPTAGAAPLNTRSRCTRNSVKYMPADAEYDAWPEGKLLYAFSISASSGFVHTALDTEEKGSGSKLKSASVALESGKQRARKLGLGRPICTGIVYDYALSR